MKLTGSLESGGSKRTLEPAVLGLYLKPISFINCSVERLVTDHIIEREGCNFTLTKWSHFIDLIPCVPLSSVLRSWCASFPVFLDRLANQLLLSPFFSWASAGLSLRENLEKKPLFFSFSEKIEAWSDLDFTFVFEPSRSFTYE